MRRVQADDVIRTPSSHESVSELSDCRSSLPVFTVEQAGGRRIGGRHGLEAKAPGDFQEANQILYRPNDRPSPCTPGIARCQRCGTGPFSRKRSAPHAVAHDSQRRVAMHSQPGVLAGYARPLMRRSTYRAGDDAGHYKSHPSSDRDGALFGFALRDRFETLIVTSWKNCRICRASSARYTRASGSARKAFRTS